MELVSFVIARVEVGGGNERLSNTSAFAKMVSSSDILSGANCQD